MIENTIISGNALEEIKKLPDNFIDMIITSPPYWGLRDYGLQDVVFGDNPNCKHQWKEHVKRPLGGKGSKGANVGAKKNDFANMRDHDVISYFCELCSAWRGQLGQEPHHQMYINHLVEIFNESKRILKDSGSIWVNLGDTYLGQKPFYVDGIQESQIKKKSLVGIPDRFKIAMIDDGWICRNEVIWHKPNQMPSSVKDRFTSDFEKFYFFTKNEKYYFEQQLEPYVSVENHNLRDKSSEKYVETNLYSKGARDYYSQGGRNKRCVWSINTTPLKEAHFAVYPEKLIETPILACCPENGIVLDVFFGSGTTGIVSKKLNRKYLGIEMNLEYIKIAEKRLKDI